MFEAVPPGLPLRRDIMTIEEAHNLEPGTPVLLRSDDTQEPGVAETRGTFLRVEGTQVIARVTHFETGVPMEVSRSPGTVTLPERPARKTRRYQFVCECGQTCRKIPCHRCNNRRRCEGCGKPSHGLQRGWCPQCRSRRLPNATLTRGTPVTLTPAQQARVDARIEHYRRRAEAGLPLFEEVK